MEQRSQALFYQLYHMQLSSHGFLKELVFFSSLFFFFFSFFHPTADLVEAIGFCHELVPVALYWSRFALVPAETPSEILRSVSQKLSKQPNGAAKQKHFIDKNT